ILVELQALGHEYLRLMFSEWFAAASCHRPGSASRPARGGAGRAGASIALIRSLLHDDGEHITGGEHEVLLAAVLDLGAAVLAVQHDVADLDVHGDALGASVIEAARAHRKEFALLGLLLRGVWDDQ